MVFVKDMKIISCIYSEKEKHYTITKEYGAMNGVASFLIRVFGFEPGYEKILGRERYLSNGTLSDVNLN